MEGDAMNGSVGFNELVGFFEEYADFTSHMASSETEKVRALISNELPRIEHAISVAQANAMKLENMEQQRIKLQERAGCGGKTFSEIIENAPDEEKERLRVLFLRIQGSVEDIKQRNEKSVDIASANMRRLNIELEPRSTDTTPASAYMRVKENKGSGPMLETKV
ncbi:MAG: flagellar export chaperone FlgN [Hydrogenoanaerobacterium sp.]